MLLSPVFRLLVKFDPQTLRDLGFILAFPTLSGAWLLHVLRHSYETNAGKAVYVYTMKYYSAIKMNEISSLAAMRMDSDMIIRSGASQAKTKITRYHLQVESKKLVERNLLTK